jgi:thiosulfate dehydrogenase (quinone) large subunit
METSKFTRWQMIALALLRIMVGWHFLYEGIAKMLKPAWSASGYLMQSRGPLSGFFRWIAGNTEVLAVVNQMNMWGLVLIGLGLIVGCLTRTAAGAGLMLILMYYLCNPPFVGYFYSIPSEGNYLIVNKNLVEAAAILVIIVFSAGRYYGFDLIIHKLLKRKRS